MTYQLSRRRFNQIGLGLGTSLGLAPLSGAVRTPRLALATEHGIPELLQVTPFVGPSWLEAGETFFYADLALQLETVGVDPIDDVIEVDDDTRRPWIRAIQQLPMVGPFAQYLLAPDWRSLMGFATGQVEQMAMVGLPPEQVTILRGRFDLDEIRAALSDSGYRSEEIDGTEVLRIRDDGEFDISELISRWWLAQANNIALLDDSTIALTSTEARITQVINAAADATSLADQADISALFPADLEDLVGAIGVTGGTLVSVGDPTVFLDPDFDADDFATAEAARADAAQLPPIRQALFGTTPGGPITDEPATPAPDEAVAQAQIRALFLDRSAADAAAPIIEERLETGLSVRTGGPWSDVLESWELEVVGDEGLVVIRFGLPGQIARRIYQLYPARDVGFLAWP